MTVSIKNTRSDRIVFGGLMIVLAVFLMAVQDGIIKFVSSDITLWQLYVLRALIATPLLIVIAVFSNRMAAIWPLAFERWALIRGGLLVMMYVSIYAAIPELPLAVVAAGMYTAPLFIALFSAVLLNEPVGVKTWLALKLGAVGVTVILRPGTDVFSFFAMLPVLAGLLYALAAILARSKCYDQHPLSLAMALNAGLLSTGIMASFLIMLWQPKPFESAISPFLFSPWAQLVMADWVFLTVLAVLTVGIGISLAIAYQAAPPATVATFDYSYLIFATLIGFIFFSEIPDWYMIVGMILIASAGLITVPKSN